PSTPSILLIITSTYIDTYDHDSPDVDETGTHTCAVEITGNVTLAEVRVDDSMLTIGEAPRTLRPGESFTFSVAHVLTQEEVDAARGDAPGRVSVVSLASVWLASGRADGLYYRHDARVCVP